MFLYRDDYSYPDLKNGQEVGVKIAKNRNGQMGTVKLEFVRVFGRFRGR
jgi:replicative DNA helicase